ncbi:MAG: Calx-beta domain-containing protein [Pirellulales bacterium]
MASDISISDATAIEGSNHLKFIDQFIPEGSEFVRPRQPAFGPDGNGDGVEDLYIASADTDEILRYDGDTGAFLDVFVSQGSGGLNGPADLEFGPDGNLYVSGFEGNHVLRYDGLTGAFLDEIGSGLAGPIGLTFGSDGALYIASHFGSQVLKYDSSGLSVFVPPGSGGLIHARNALFGPDANGDGTNDLYVASGESWQVLRYDGLTGGFIDVFATTDGPAAWMEVGPDGDLYVGVAKNPDAEFVRFDIETGALVDSLFVETTSFWFIVDQNNVVYNPNGYDLSILRHGPSSLAVFTVSLSSPSASSVTVDFQTMDGSAQAGTDYVPTTGTLTFAPGQTTRTILVQTIDDAISDFNEAFSVVLSNASAGAVIADAQGVATIQDNDLPPTKFYVVNDATQNRTYEYGATGAAVENYALNSGNTAPRGAASTVAGDKTWVVDANRKVYVYNNSGALLGSWTAGSLASNATVEGIATNGTDVWIVDARKDRVYHYTGAATRLSSSQNAASSFALNSGNRGPKDIVTDGVYLWVVNNSTTNKVFKYTLSGSLVGSWTITSGGGSPTGITIDPANVSDIWIVDSSSDRVYQYTAATSRTSGSQSPASSFALAADNTNPQGIADPPSVDSQPTAHTSAVAAGIASLNRRTERDSSTPAERLDRNGSQTDLRMALDFVFSRDQEFGPRRLRKAIRS